MSATTDTIRAQLAASDAERWVLYAVARRCGFLIARRCRMQLREKLVEVESFFESNRGVLLQEVRATDQNCTVNRCDQIEAELASTKLELVQAQADKDDMVRTAIVCTTCLFTRATGGYVARYHSLNQTTREDTVFKFLPASCRVAHSQVD